MHSRISIIGGTQCYTRLCHMSPKFNNTAAVGMDIFKVVSLSTLKISLLIM